jgi:thymidylate synthase (FAD)
VVLQAQILRHRSFTFQEFSQRYADSTLLTENIPIPDLRRQDTKNRQNSTDDLGDYVKLKFQTEIAELFTHSNNLYKRMLELG